MSQQPRVVDYTPLRTPVGRWDAQYFVDQVKTQPAYGHWHLTRTSLGWAVAALVVLLGAEIALFAVFGGRAFGRAWTPGEILLFAAGIALIVVAYVSLAVTVVQGILAPRRVDALARLIRFANRNGLSYEPIAPNRAYSGDRFAGLYLRDRVADPDGAFDYGQRLQPGRHGAHSGTSVGWYLAIALEHPAPASAVLTPTLRELLTDGRTTCDVEVVDRWLFVFPRRSTALVSYGSEAFHRRMLRIVAAAGEAAGVRPARIHDDGEDAGRLAVPRGRRLPVVALLVGILLPPIVATVPFWPAIASAVIAAP